MFFFVANQLSSMPPSKRQQQPADFNLGSQTVGLPPSSVVCSIPAGVLKKQGKFEVHYPVVNPRHVRLCSGFLLVRVPMNG